MEILDKFFEDHEGAGAEMRVAVMQAYDSIPPHWQMGLPDLRVVITNIPSEIFSQKVQFVDGRLTLQLCGCSAELAKDDNFPKSFMMLFFQLFCNTHVGLERVIMDQSRNLGPVLRSREDGMYEVLSPVEAFIYSFPDFVLGRKDRIVDRGWNFLARINHQVKYGHHLSLQRVSQSIS